MAKQKQSTWNYFTFLAIEIAYILLSTLKAVFDAVVTLAYGITGILGMGIALYYSNIITPENFMTFRKLAVTIIDSWNIWFYSILCLYILIEIREYRKK